MSNGIITKNVNGKDICLYDDIVWSIRNVLHRSSVVDFGEHYTMTDDKYRIFARNGLKNDNIMVIEKSMSFGGITIK